MTQPVRLTPADAGRYTRLRRRMLEAEPWAFSSSPDDDRVLADPGGTLADPLNVVVAVQAAGDLVAAAGLRWNDRRKFVHRAMIWGVFVEPSHRGQGLGRAVMRSLVDLARSRPEVDYLDLTVSAGSPEALALYQSLGFVTWGREPEATEVDGQRHDELHMTLRL
jgi:ribosomal protein S18 acetylase RimI-like enzyme